MPSCCHESPLCSAGRLSAPPTVPVGPQQAAKALPRIRLADHGSTTGPGRRNYGSQGRSAEKGNPGALGRVTQAQPECQRREPILIVIRRGVYNWSQQGRRGRAAAARAGRQLPPGSATVNVTGSRADSERPGGRLVRREAAESAAKARGWKEDNSWGAESERPLGGGASDSEGPGPARARRATVTLTGPRGSPEPAHAPPPVR